MPRSVLAAPACLALTAIALLAAFIHLSREASAAPICGAGGTATKTWDGGGGDANWATPTNWAPDGVPAATDHVCIDSASVSVSSNVGSIASLEAGTLSVVGSGSLNITDTGQLSSIATLGLSSGGKLGGAANLTVATLNWGSGGQHLAPSNSTTTTVTTALNAVTGFPVNAGPPITELLDRTLVLANNATGTLSQGDGAQFHVTGGGRVQIDSGAAFNIAANVSIGGAFGSHGSMLNNGTLRKSAGTGTSSVDVSLTNNTAVEVQAGTLQLSNNGATDGDGGTFSLSDGTVLQFAGGGTHSLGLSTISDGAGSATVRFQGASSPAVTLTKQNGLDVNAVEVPVGTLTLGEANTIPTLSLAGNGKLDGAGNLTVGTFNWGPGGRHSAPSNSTTTTVTNALNVQSGPPVNAGPPLTELLDRTLRLAPTADATLTQVVGGSLFHITNNARLEIQKNVSDQAVFDIIGGADISGAFGSHGTIINDGVIRKSTAATTTTLSVPTTNNGTVEVTDGTLEWDPTLTSPGTIDVRSGATFDAPTTFTNTGTLKGSGTVAGNVTSSGTVAPGQSPGTLTLTGNYTQTSAGTLATEIAGAGAGQFDRLVVGGTASLDGTLAIQTVSPFVPADNHTFEVVSGTRTGTFPTVTGKSLPNGGEYLVQYGASDVTLAVPRRIYISDVSDFEGNSGPKQFEFTVSLSSPAPPGGVSFGYVHSAGTATADVDYVPEDGSGIVIPEGQTSTTIDIAVKGNVTQEPDETFFVDLVNVSGAAVADAQGKATIKDDDGPPLISIGDVSDFEGNSGTKFFEFTVSLSSPAPAGGVSFDHQQKGGTATPGDDYVNEDGPKLIAEGQTSTTLYIEVNGDTTFEPDETFLVNLVNVVGALVADGEGIGTIKNDEFISPLPPQFSIGDVVASEGNSGPKQFEFTVSLSSPAPPGGVSFDYLRGGGTATAGPDYTNFVPTGGLRDGVPEGQMSGTIDVAVNGDTAFEPDETFFVTVQNVSGASVVDGQGMGTIKNDDPLPEISLSGVTQKEGGFLDIKEGPKTTLTDFRFKVSLNQPAPTGGVAVGFVTVNESARAPADFIARSDRLTIRAGSRSRTLTIQVQGDAVWETTEKFTVKLRNASGGTIVDALGTGTIEDDDFVTGLYVDQNTTEKLTDTVVLTTFCGSPCTLLAAGSLTFSSPGSTASASRRFALKGDRTRSRRGGKVKLRLKVPARVRRQAKRTLRAGGKVTANVTLKAKFRGGKTKTRRARIRLRR